MFLSYSHADNWRVGQSFQQAFSLLLRNLREKTGMSAPYCTSSVYEQRVVDFLIRLEWYVGDIAKNYRPRYLAYSKRQRAAGQAERPKQTGTKWISIDGKVYPVKAFEAYTSQDHPTRRRVLLERLIDSITMKALQEIWPEFLEFWIKKQLNRAGVPWQDAEGAYCDVIILARHKFNRLREPDAFADWLKCIVWGTGHRTYTFQNCNETDSSPLPLWFVRFNNLVRILLTIYRDFYSDLLRPPNRLGCLCDSCGGVVVTVVFGGTDRPQLRLRPGSKGRRHIRLYDERGSRFAHTSLRREVCCAGQGTVFGCPKISIICGGCGASLIRFEGGAYD